MTFVVGWGPPETSGIAAMDCDSGRRVDGCEEALAVVWLLEADESMPREVILDVDDTGAALTPKPAQG